MKSSRNTSTSGKPASGRRTPVRKTKAKKRTTRTMPVWMRNTLALIVVGVFSLTFYYFVIRPYSYRWKECYGRKEFVSLVAMRCMVSISPIIRGTSTGRS